MRAIVNLDRVLNNRAWLLATGPEPQRDPAVATRMAALSVALSPGEQLSLNTLGVALYRAGRFAEAIETLGKSLEAGHGQYDAFDLFFLAMAHHRLGHREEARSALDRAIEWLTHPGTLAGDQAGELAAFRAEAEAVLAGPARRFTRRRLRLTVGLVSATRPTPKHKLISPGKFATRPVPSHPWEEGPLRTTGGDGPEYVTRFECFAISTTKRSLQ